MPSSETSLAAAGGGRCGPSPEFLQLLLADGRLPTGAHTQSGGLEPALQHGMPPADVPRYLLARLRTVTEVEAAAAVIARHVWLNAADRSAALADVDEAWRVRTLSDGVRDASDLLGRGYARLASAMWSLGLDAGRTHCRAVAVGATGAAAGLGATQVARLIGYDDVQAVIAAALKLAPFDPADGVRWAVAAGPEVDALAARVAGATSIDDMPAYSAPLIEQWAQWHRIAERRLYRA
jgi:urease accessory protein